MKLVTIISLLLTLTTPLTAESKDNTPSQEKIDIYNYDITGNSSQEAIRLSGSLLTSDSNYYKDIWLNISNAKGEKWRIPLQGGYSPYLNFMDLNSNGSKDILYQSEKERKNNLHNYSLHTVKNNELKKIKLPEQNHLTADYEDNFKVSVNLNHGQEPIIVNISNQAKKYINHNIYRKNGELIHDSSPVISPITHFEPIKLKNSNRYGLKSYQEIGGVNQKDSKLGDVETTWKYKNGQWIILNTNWEPKPPFK